MGPRKKDSSPECVLHGKSQWQEALSGSDDPAVRVRLDALLRSGVCERVRRQRPARGEPHRSRRDRWACGRFPTRVPRCRATQRQRVSYGLIVVGSPGLILDDVEIIAGEAVPGADGARGTNGSDGAAGGDGICRDAGVSGFAIRCPSSMGGGGGRGGFGRGIGRAGRTPVIGLAFGGAGGSEREDGEPGGNGAVLRRRPSTGDSAQFDGDVDPANERWEFASVAEAGRDGGTGGGGAGGGGGVSAPPGEAPSSRTGGGGGAGGNGGCAGGGGNLGRNGGAGGRGQDGSNGSGGTTSSGGRGANGEVDTVRGCE